MGRDRRDYIDRHPRPLDPATHRDGAGRLAVVRRRRLIPEREPGEVENLLRWGDGRCLGRGGRRRRIRVLPPRNEKIPEMFGFALNVQADIQR